MITDSEISIKINNGNISWFKKKYDYIKLNDILVIKPTDLSLGSKFKINVECDFCNKPNNISYRDYIKNIKKHDMYTCIKCCTRKIKLTSLEKYGVEHYAKTNEYMDNMIKNNLIKYDTEYFVSTDEFREKSIVTNLEKYGETSYTKTDDYLIKSKETSMQRYGVDNYAKIDEYKEKIINTTLERYGVTNYTKTDEYLIKSKETSFLKYGVDNYAKTDECKEKIKEVNLEKYGVECYTQTNEYKERVKNTYLEKYGVDSFFKTEEYLIKYKATSMLHYGVEHPMKDITVFTKSMKNSFLINEYKDLYYRGTYELDFIIFCEKLNINIINGRTINYNVNHIYYPDFYLKELNLIIEIKSNYTYKSDLEKNLLKQKACLEQGYNFIFIIDKNYDEFLKLIK